MSRPGRHLRRTGALFMLAGLLLFLGALTPRAADLFRSIAPSPKPTLNDAEQAIPRILDQIYSALDDGQTAEVAPFMAADIAGDAEFLNHFCRPSTHRAHYIASTVQLQDGAFLARERALFKPFSEKAHLLWFKRSGGRYFLFAVRDDPFTQEIESASNTVRQFIFAARAGEWDLAARYVSPHLPIEELKTPAWAAYLAKITGVEIHRYIYNPEIQRTARGLILIKVNAAVRDFWYPDFLVDPTTGTIVKAFYPQPMGGGVKASTGAPTADGITDPEIERDALKRFGLIKDAR